MEDEKPEVVYMPERAVWGTFKPSPDATPVEPKPKSIMIYDPRPKWEREA